MSISEVNIPNLVKNEVLGLDQEAEVILFGSRARGDFAADSDWDFLILLSKPIDPELEDLIRDRLYDIELETEQIITSIIEDKSGWDKYEKTLIYRNIQEQRELVA